MLQGKKILLGITGSIAAYKAAVLARLLMKEGCEVQCLMTKSACDFIGPLSLTALTGKQVYTDISSEHQWNNHVHLGLWADLMIVAPASANSLAKCANGIVDNILNAVYLSARCPILFAPAMDEDMWLHPSTQSNITKLKSYHHTILDVNNGPLASGLVGLGRMAEPEDILQAVRNHFHAAQSLSQKQILITAGPTYESIDPVRFIGNRSSGKMGIAIASEALYRGANVTLVLGPTSESVQSHPKLQLIRVESANQMAEAVHQHYACQDIFILAAAVADYTPEEVSSEKIKKQATNGLELKLVQTKDIAALLGQYKTDHQLLVGFALETEHLFDHAKAKLHKKNMDLIVMNSAKDEGSGFGGNTNKISILDKSGGFQEFDLKPKSEVAKDIFNTIEKYIHAT